MDFSGQWILLNGEWNRGSAIPASKLYRLWALQDGVFETMHFSGSQIFWLEKHLQRLGQSLEWLGMSCPENLEQKIFQAVSDEYFPRRPVTLRLSCWRPGEGTYPSKCSEAEWMLHFRPAINPQFSEVLDCKNLVPVQLPFYPAIPGKIPNAWMVHATREIQPDSEALLVLPDQRIVETHSANVFVYDAQRGWRTPGLNSGCLPGIIRERLLFLFEKHGVKCLEVDVFADELEEAEHIWLTNAVSGIRYLKSWKNRTLHSGPCEYFLKLLLSDALHGKRV